MVCIFKRIVTLSSAYATAPTTRIFLLQKLKKIRDASPCTLIKDKKLYNPSLPIKGENT